MRETDHGMDRLQAVLRDLGRRDARVAVGVVDGSGGEEPVSEGLSMAGLAAVHEFGATINHPGGTPYTVVGGQARFVRKDSPEGIEAIAAGRVTGPHVIEIPERAPLRKTIDEQGGQIKAAAVRVLTDMIDGKRTLENALDTLGEFTAGQVRRTIQRGVEPANAPSTIRQKKSSKPLVDEGLMVRSYTHQVRMGE